MLFALSHFFQLLSFGPQGYGDELLYGAGRTLEISFFAYLLGLALGFIGAIAKLHGGGVIRSLFVIYTTVFRAVPELVLLLLLFYAGMNGINHLFHALGWADVTLNGLAAAIIVLGVVQGAYATEILRGAMLAVPVGQIEAARALGMSRGLILRRITIPVMLPLALPGLANLWLTVMKDSALIAIVGYTELALATRQAAGVTKEYFLFYFVAACIYLTLSLVSVKFYHGLERQLRHSRPEEEGG